MESVVYLLLCTRLKKSFGVKKNWQSLDVSPPAFHRLRLYLGFFSSFIYPIKIWYSMMCVFGIIKRGETLSIMNKTEFPFFEFLLKEVWFFNKLLSVLSSKFLS